MKASKKAFQHVTVLRSVTAANRHAAERFETIYQRTIDFGGHPERARRDHQCEDDRGAGSPRGACDPTARQWRAARHGAQDHGSVRDDRARTARDDLWSKIRAARHQGGDARSSADEAVSAAVRQTELDNVRKVALVNARGDLAFAAGHDTLIPLRQQPFLVCRIINSKFFNGCVDRRLFVRRHDCSDECCWCAAKAINLPAVFGRLLCHGLGYSLGGVMST
jgi:hypothetical protein